MDEKQKEILKKLKAIYESKGALSEEDLIVLAEAKDIDFDDSVFKEAEQYMLDIASDPERLANIEKQQKAGKLSGTLTNALETFNSIRDLVVSRDQITSSEEALASSIEPAAPKATPKSRELARSIENARLAASDASPSINAARQQIEDTYRSELQAGRTASTGQASSFGSLAQAAAGRRQRGATQLAATTSDVLARNRGRLDTLTAQQLAESQAGFNQNLQLHDRSQRQYNREQQAAGELGATGRSNLRNSLRNIGGIIPGVANTLSNIPGRQREADIGIHPLGSNIQGVEDQLNYNLRTPYPDFQTPGQGYNPYGIGANIGNALSY